MAAHKVAGKFYTFASSPIGDQLIVRPYRGELGSFEVGAGTRKLDKLTVRGSVRGLERAAPVGGEVTGGSPAAARQCELPVGDYQPTFLTFDFGPLLISVSDNYHSDGKPRDRGNQPPVHGIHIAKGKPFVFDFGNQPEVMFASPARAERIKAGETLEVKAVLIDPKLDMMIRRLDDTRLNQPQTAPGERQKSSLDPKVLVLRANGEKVAEGVMPFG